MFDTLLLVIDWSCVHPYSQAKSWPLREIWKLKWTLCSFLWFYSHYGKKKFYGTRWEMGFTHKQNNNKKSWNGDTLGSVELILQPEEGNQGDHAWWPGWPGWWGWTWGGCEVEVEVWWGWGWGWSSGGVHEVALSLLGSVVRRCCISAHSYSIPPPTMSMMLKLVCHPAKHRHNDSWMAFT